MIQVALAIWYVIIFTIVITLTVLGLVLLTPEKTIGYDCQRAEYPLAVDVTKAYIEACREARKNK
jgi:hypothetical protein